MGIKGLWQALKEYVYDGHISQFREQRVAVDLYVWLHRSIKDCIVISHDKLVPCLESKYPPVSGDASTTQGSSDEVRINMEDVVQINGRFIDYIVSKVEMLQRFGVVPVCVFDGADMPMKQGTNDSRQERREQAFAEAMQLLETQFVHDGGVLHPHSRAYVEARQCLEKTIDISTELAHAVIQVLREEKHIECIVAPYEADAQLAYLCREGYVQAVISEDSDLIAYYCPCIISKLDSYYGRCDVLRPAECAPLFFAKMANTSLRRKRPREHASPPTSAGPHHLTAPSSTSTGADGDVDVTATTANATAVTFTYESFLLACILSGCDYVSNLRSVGIRTVFRMVPRASTLPQLLEMIHEHHGFPMDELRRYRRSVLDAFYCFAHHIVYCPYRKCLVHYHPIPTTAPTSTSPSSLPDSVPSARTDLIGCVWGKEVACKVCADCTLDPTTLELYKGTYQHCLEGYLRRSRQGQTSLRTFSGFQRFSTPRVVLHEAGGRGGSQEKSSAQSDAVFGSPLKRVRVASGFCSTPAPTAGLQSTTAARRVVVRSKHFLRGCVTVPVDSFLDEDEHEERCSGSDAIHTNGSSASTDQTSLSPMPQLHMASEGGNDPISSQDPTTYVHSCPTASPVLLGTTSAAVLSTETSATNDSALDGSPAAHSSSLVGGATAGGHSQGRRESSRRGDHRQPVTTALGTASADAGECPCPFGYWQCGRRHSVFEQCFEGKLWTRGERAPTTVAASAAASNHTSRSSMDVAAALQRGPGTSNGVGGGFTSKGFRPPRSLAEPPTTASSMESCDATQASHRSRSGRDEDGKEPATPPAAPGPSSVLLEASVFRTLAYKRALE